MKLSVFLPIPLLKMSVWLIALPHCHIFDYYFSYGNLHIDNSSDFMNRRLFLNLLHFAQAFSLSWVSLRIDECICKFQDVQFLWVGWNECGGVKEEKKKRSPASVKFLVPHINICSLTGSAF